MFAGVHDNFRTRPDNFQGRSYNSLGRLISCGYVLIIDYFGGRSHGDQKSNR